MPDEKNYFAEMYANKTVQGYVQKLLDRMELLFPFLKNSKEDFRQEMWIEASKALKRYDPGRNASLSTFTCLVMQRALYKSVKRELQIRNHEMFLDDLVNPENKDGEVDKENTSMYMPVETGCIDGFPLSIRDLHDILECMSPEERTICQKIMAGKSLNVIALEMHVSRTRFYRDVMPALRLHFKNLAGML